MRVTWRLMLPVVLVLTAAIVAGRGAEDASGQTFQMPDGQTGVRVRGQGVITATPDVAVVNISATTRQETPGEAFNRVASRVAALTEILRANGVAERDIQTQQLALFQEFGPPRPPAPGEPAEPPVFLGWRARQSLSIKLRDFTIVGRLIDTAVATLEDTAELQGIGFQFENNEALIDRARDLAADDAREKAERLATRLGGRLGRLIFAQELSGPLPSAQPFATPTPARTATPAPPGVRPAAAPVEVSPGEQTIIVTVEAHFALE